MISVHKRSIRIAGHNTSLSLEPEFWDELKRLAAERNLSLNELVGSIDKTRKGNLSSTLRVFVLNELRSRLSR